MCNVFVVCCLYYFEILFCMGACLNVQCECCLSVCVWDGCSVISIVCACLLCVLSVCVTLRGREEDPPSAPCRPRHRATGAYLRPGARRRQQRKPSVISPGQHPGDQQAGCNKKFKTIYVHRPSAPREPVLLTHGPGCSLALPPGPRFVRRGVGPVGSRRQKGTDPSLRSSEPGASRSSCAPPPRSLALSGECRRPIVPVVKGTDQSRDPSVPGSLQPGGDGGRSAGGTRFRAAPGRRT